MTIFGRSGGFQIELKKARHKVSDNILPEPLDETQFIYAALRLVGLDSTYANCLDADNCEGSSDILELALRQLREIQQRQLPVGWHVGRMRGGELVPLIDSGHLYLACVGMWSVNSGGFTEEENGFGNDIIEIDGVKTKAGEG